MLNAPPDPTVTSPWSTLFSLMVTVTGLDVASFVVPATVTLLLFVVVPSTGEVIFNVGGTVSTFVVTDF